MDDMNDEASHDDDAKIEEPRLWRDNGWTARVIKNDDDEGWAVAMIKDGEAEPALVGPWTMGRDKKNPKPLDVNAFNTLVKTASEVLRRHEQQLHAMLHKNTVRQPPRGASKSSSISCPTRTIPYALLSPPTNTASSWRGCACRPASSCRRPRPWPGSRTISARRASLIIFP
jgi:hypothetical protein